METILRVIGSLGACQSAGFLDLKNEQDSCFKGLRALDWLQENCNDARLTPLTTKRSQSVKDVVDIMYKQRANQVVVLDNEGDREKPVGVLTQDRIFNALREHQCTMSTKITELGVDSLKTVRHPSSEIFRQQRFSFTKNF